MDEDISTLLGRYERLLSELHLALDDIEGRKADALRIEEIHGFLQRFGDLGEFVAYINGIQDSIYVLKESLTSKEAAKYLGISLSYLHKLTIFLRNAAGITRKIGQLPKRELSEILLSKIDSLTP